MRKTIAVLVLILFISFTSISQSVSIKGTISDTSENKNLPNAVITLLTKKDSILVKYTRSDKEGNFKLSQVDSGNYILWITYPKFADYTDALQINPAADVDLRTIPLTLKSV